MYLKIETENYDFLTTLKDNDLTKTLINLLKKCQLA